MKRPLTRVQYEAASIYGVILVADDGTVLYSNARGGEVLGWNASSSGSLVSEALHEFRLKFLQSGASFAAERLHCSRTGKELLVSVSLVYSNESGRSATVFLVLDASDWPPAGSHLPEALASLLREYRSGPSEELRPEFQVLKGEDARFQRTLLQAQKGAKTHLPVLIIGDSGTGKEGLARAIHQASERNGKPFVDINCAAIPDSLIESELFGYEGGAFTGARQTGRTGLFDQAHGGTIFLDEIGDASLQTQAKILRVLQEGCFKRISGTRNVVVDVRLISATNKKLMELISQGSFRQDLIYRLNTITINLPPLRERRGDIRLLAEHFLRDHGRAEGKSFAFSPEAMRLMETYPWPGNVRELKGVVDYAATMASSAVLTADSLPSFMRDTTSNFLEQSKADRQSLEYGGGQGLLNRTLQEVERTLIKQVLSESRTRSEAIKTLGISRRAFYLKIKQYGLG
jgi:transcriptional regulator with PAS, ATPase and Fis domain